MIILATIIIDPFISEVLSSINLNEYERKAYLSILEEGKVVARNISRKSGIPYAKVYQTLDALIDKGFILKDDGRPKKFYAIDPKTSFTRRLEFLEREWRSQQSLREMNVEKILPSLVLLFNETKPQQKTEGGVWKIIGLEEIFNKVDTLMISVSERILITSNNSKLINQLLNRVYRPNLEIIIRSPKIPENYKDITFIKIPVSNSSTICVIDEYAMITIFEVKNNYTAVLTKMNEMIKSYLSDIEQGGE